VTDYIETAENYKGLVLGIVGPDSLCNHSYGIESNINWRLYFFHLLYFV